MKNKFTLSIEEIESANGVVESESCIDITEGDLEEHSDNIANTQADVLELVQATETGEDATKNLAEIAASVEALGIYGATNANTTAAFLVAGINREFARLAGPGVRAARFIPGLESLEDHLDKTNAVREDGGTELVVDPVPEVAPITGDELKPAVEGILSSVSKIGAKLVDNLRKVGKAITDHFAAVFAGFNGLKRRAFTIKQKARTANGDATHPTIIANGLHRLALEGKVDSKSILKGLKVTADVTDFAFDGYIRTVGDFYSAYATYLSKAESDIRKNHGWTALNEGIQAMTKTFKEDAAKAFGAHSNGGVLSGDRVFEMTTGHYPTLNKKKGAASTLSKQETETLSPKDVIAVCEIVSNMATKFVRYDELYLKVMHAREKALNDAYALIESGKHDISHDSASFSLIGFASGFVHPVMDLGGYAFTVMRSALAYADRSLKEYTVA